MPQQAQIVAKEYGVSYEVMDAIIDNESKWNPDAVGDNGESCGLVQIHLPDHPGITCDQAREPLFALRFLASEIKAGREWKWTSCSCVQFVKAMGVKVKGDASAIAPNGPPTIGGLVLFDYNGVGHVALIESFTSTGIHVKEANFEKCRVTERDVSFDDPHVRGYWIP